MMTLTLCFHKLTDLPGITVYAENCSLKENGENEEQKSTFSLMAMQYIGQ